MSANRLVVPTRHLRKLTDLTYRIEEEILKALHTAKEMSNTNSAPGQFLQSRLEQTQSIAEKLRNECACLMNYLSINGMGKTIPSGPRESNRNSERSASDD